MQRTEYRVLYGFVFYDFGVYKNNNTRVYFFSLLVFNFIFFLHFLNFQTSNTFLYITYKPHIICTYILVSNYQPLPYQHLNYSLLPLVCHLLHMVSHHIVLENIQIVLMIIHEMHLHFEHRNYFQILVNVVLPY